jgi:glycerol uptake facilitator-like aquaporin
LNRSLARALVAESIGTFAIIVAGAGAIMVDCAAAPNNEAA